MNLATRRTLVDVQTGTVRASDPFSKYKRETRSEVRRAEVQETEALTQLRDAWRNFNFNSRSGLDGNYKRVVSCIKDTSYSAKDIEKFSLVIIDFQDEEHFSHKAGIFLSALINSGAETDYIIHAEHLEQGLCFLGYQNTKNITINGNAGMWTGMQMTSGTIVIEGNARFQLGMGMRGGRIVISGNAGIEVGAFMRDGEIQLNGTYRSLCADIRGGKIFHEGQLIYPAPE